MKAIIDLEKIATRESEQVEWKENVGDIDDIVATLCAFANDIHNLGGGYVVCGACETKDEHGFQRILISGLTASRFKEIEGTVLSRCQERVNPAIVPLVDELPTATADRRLLVFTIAATRMAHTCRRHDGSVAHYVRVGRSTRQARNGLLLRLLTQKGAIEPWDERPCSTAILENIDLLSLRATFQRIGLKHASDHVATYLSEQEALSPFVPTLCVRDPLTHLLRPRNFSIILFGIDPQRCVPGAVSVFAAYPGIDRATKTAQHTDLSGTILDQFRRLWIDLEARAITIFDKSSIINTNLELYPKQALFEALVNAVVHRDYEIRDPTRVTIFVDRIEIYSPGALPLGVSLTQLRRGKAAPKWRNRSLAWFFHKLDLAQAEGQGVSTIQQSMKNAGCPPPRFTATATDVTCTLYANQRAQQLLAEISEILPGQNTAQKLDNADLS